MDKGARVRIVSGRQGVGQAGTIFWKGANKFGGGERFGVKGDDGATYWVNDTEVEALEASDPLAKGPVAKHTFSRGDRVRFRVGEDVGTGEVFWTGQSRSGPGQRLGVRPDGSEEAVWLDGHQAEPTDEPKPAPAPAPAGMAPDDGLERAPEPAPTQHEMPPMNDGPGWDDYDASAVPVEEEPPDGWM